MIRPVRPVAAKAIAAVLTSLVGLGQVAAAVAPPPVIDMHLHAMHADDQGPPPVAICAPYGNAKLGTGWPVRDPRTSGAEFADAFFHRPTCTHPLWGARDDDALREEIARGEVAGIGEMTGSTTASARTTPRTNRTSRWPRNSTFPSRCTPVPARRAPRTWIRRWPRTGSR